MQQLSGEITAVCHLPFPSWPPDSCHRYEQNVSVGPKEQVGEGRAQQISAHLSLATRPPSVLREAENKYFTFSDSIIGIKRKKRQCVPLKGFQA